MRKLWLAACVTVGALAPSAQAVVSGTGDGMSNTSAPTIAPNTTLTGWSNVGSMSVDGASGVYLGNGWVLTADHVVVGGGGGVPGPITFDSVPGSYTWDGSPIQTLSTVTLGNADLVMYHLSAKPALSTLTVAPASLSSTFYAIGYGLNRSSSISSYTASGGTLTTDATYNPSATYQGYAVGSFGSTKQWASGTSSADLTYDTDGYGDTYFFYSNFSATGAQIEMGDSGGGVFNSLGDLIGINIGINDPDGITSQPEAAIYGDYSFYAYLGDYETQIDSIVITPEPCTTSFLLVGFAAAALRRRRTASAI